MSFLRRHPVIVAAAVVLALFAIGGVVFSCGTTEGEPDVTAGHVHARPGSSL